MLSYLSLAAGFMCLGWLSERLEAVPSVHLGPWDLIEAPLVIVDAGHGGHDGGAVAGGAVEKDLALTLAQQLRDCLIAEGLRVKMTRDGDTFLPLEERAAVANEAQANAFVSIHLNTSSAPEVSGIETYYTERKSLSAQRALQARWQLTASSVKDQRGRWLAETLQRHVCQTTQAENRGVKERNYAVVTHTQIPAVLVECGFLTHPGEAARLKSSDYQKQLVQGLTQGIREFVQARKDHPNRGVVELEASALASADEAEPESTTP